jgi:hypothetical protein
MLKANVRPYRRAAPLLAALGLLAHPGVAPAQDLPQPVGPEVPRVEPMREVGGLYSQRWFALSFLDMREDLDEANAEGKRFAVIFEQRGCPYCMRLHTEVLALKYINDYVRENFRIVQLDLWGAREVADFDGAKMPEKALAERWASSSRPPSCSSRTT